MPHTPTPRYQPPTQLIKATQDALEQADSSGLLNALMHFRQASGTSSDNPGEKSVRLYQRAIEDLVGHAKSIGKAVQSLERNDLLLWQQSLYQKGLKPLSTKNYLTTARSLILALGWLTPHNAAQD